jgi:hypothetical protein
MTFMAPSILVLNSAVQVLAGTRRWNTKCVLIHSGWRTVCWYAHVAVLIAAVCGWSSNSAFKSLAEASGYLWSSFWRQLLQFLSGEALLLCWLCLPSRFGWRHSWEHLFERFRCRSVIIWRFNDSREKDLVKSLVFLCFTFVLTLGTCHRFGWAVSYRRREG